MDVQPKTKYSLRPLFKNPTWNLWMDWGKLCYNLSFTVKDKYDKIILCLEAEHAPIFNTTHEAFF